MIASKPRTSRFASASAMGGSCRKSHARAARVTGCGHGVHLAKPACAGVSSKYGSATRAVKAEGWDYITREEGVGFARVVLGREGWDGIGREGWDDLAKSA